MASEPPAVRVTPLFRCHASRRPGWITIVFRKAGHPARKTVSPVLWKQLQTLRDAEFDGTCVLELGIGFHVLP